MPRHGNLSFCCGAGGARTWVEEKLSIRINGNRTGEAVATASAPESVEVVDVAQMLLAAVRRGTPA